MGEAIEQMLPIGGGRFVRVGSGDEEIVERKTPRRRYREMAGLEGRKA